VADKETRRKYRAAKEPETAANTVEVVEGEPVEEGAGPASEREAAPEVIEGEILSEEVTKPAAVAVEISAEAQAVVEELAGLRQQLEEAQAQVDEYLDDLRRERAAFQNYKRRQENERAELRQAAVGGVVMQIFPILDDLERALEAIPEDQAGQPWAQGITLIQRKLHNALEALGVAPTEAAPGQSFDPFVHEAVTYEEHEDFEEGQIIAVIQKGYTLNGRTLRPAMVRVAR
jgi:molecular chaperone GrpE